MSVSIPKSKDGEDRYMRDIIITSKINRFGGITRTENLRKIIEQTNIPRKMIISYFKSKLGCRIEESKDEILIFKDLEEDRLEDILEEFIEKNVICPRCKNPEFEIETGKKKDKWKCKACGDNSREY